MEQLRKKDTHFTCIPGESTGSGRQMEIAYFKGDSDESRRLCRWHEILQNIVGMGKGTIVHKEHQTEELQA